MQAVLRDEYGNPSSVYAEGAAARERVEEARAEVAALLGVVPAEVRFTGGATEANNAIVFGLLGPGDHVVTTQVEHPSIDEPLACLEPHGLAGRPARWTEGRGIAVTRVAPDEAGCVDAGDVAEAIRPETKLVTMIWANNETGAIQPVAQVAELCGPRDVLFHSDATQAIGKTSVDLSRLPVDFVSSSAHKLGGPKGVGALVGRRNSSLPAFLRGGGQERGLRGGTENVASIVGYGVACALARREAAEREKRSGALRDRMWQGIQRSVERVRWNGDPARALRNTLSVEFEGVAGEVLVQALDLEGVAVSAGAACHSGSIEPSKVLVAMGRTPEQARGSLRLSVGWGVDEQQIDRAVALLAELVPRAREVEAP